MSRQPVSFEGRAVLVTGAGRGLGRSYAMLLAARGAQVVVADNGVAMDGASPNAGQAATVVEEILAAGGRAVAFTGDLSVEDGATAAVEATLTAFGRIDALVHNASTVPLPVSIAQSQSADFDLVMRINPFAGYWMARAAWPYMARQGYGRILFTTSAGVYGAVGTAPYCAAKAANIGLMRCLAAEGGESGIFVNLVAPAANTRMTQSLLSPDRAEWLATTMTLERVAAGVVFLVSDACQINGEIIAIGGGRVARIALAENKGAMIQDLSIEGVSEVIGEAIEDERYVYPRSNAERKVLIYDAMQ